MESDKLLSGSSGGFSFARFTVTHAVNLPSSIQFYVSHQVEPVEIEATAPAARSDKVRGFTVPMNASASPMAQEVSRSAVTLAQFRV